MRNLVILGSGRSGTSAVSTLFADQPNVFFGYAPIKPMPSNPDGFYEDAVVNTVNNILLRRMTGVSLLDVLPRFLVRCVEGLFPWAHRDARSLWLARPRWPLRWEVGYELAELMAGLVSNEPFCLKDPRFSFTLQQWEPFLPADTGFLVVFRDPRQTIESMQRFASRNDLDRPLAVDRAWLTSHWLLVYRKLIADRDRLRGPDAWLFVDLADLVSGEAREAVGGFTRCRVDASHLEDRLASSGAGTMSESDPDHDECRALYEELRTIARADLASWAGGGRLG